MANIAKGAPGSSEFLIGNEAIARGVLEAGVQFCAGYPGTPATEIIASLVEVAKELGIHVEWSVNEKVATEGAAAAAFAGLKALASMKNAGLNVAQDFLLHLNLTGIGDKGGALLVVTCDDPQAWSSGDESDTRWLAEIADVPLLVPAGVQEAKDMAKWAFELSEKFKCYCILRSYKNLSHASGAVKLGEIPKPKKKPAFDTSKLYSPYLAPPKHAKLHEKQAKIQAIFESSPFNTYSGPEKPELLIISSGSGKPCSVDAVQCLKLTKSVGILNLATLWPFPKRLVAQHLAQTRKVLVVEEVDPFVEIQTKATASEFSKAPPKIYGKGSGHINYYGEVTPDAVIKALSEILEIDYKPREAEYEQKAAKYTVIDRDPVWCPGCPHRASYLCVTNAMKRDGRDAVLTSDIGCYTLDVFPGGTYYTNVLHCMGSGAGTACGFGQLNQLGFKQPVVALCGDSTFYHAAIPALMNAVQHKSNMTLVILDNGATAMTGFQPNPGTGRTATGEAPFPIPPEDIAKACGVRFIEIIDPFELEKATDTIVKAIQFEGPAVVISRRKCALLAQREKIERREKIVPYEVDLDKCSKCVVASREKIMPCEVACPAGTDIPGFLNLARQGKFSEGLELIRQCNPLPAVVGRVCYHPCETECNRAQLDEAIANHTIERFLGDYGLSLPSAKKVKARREEKVAIIGSGPAGLSCAYHLAVRGYPVTVFEATDKAGGLLRWGIPDYRLPRDILDKEISHIEELGVDIKTNTPVKDPADLFKKGFKAAFLATGAGVSQKMNIPGEDTKGILNAVSFLYQVNSRAKVELGNRVAVIGGGNAAVDSARVARRLGAKEVSIIYRRSRAEMPAARSEIDEAEKEGMKIHILAAPVKVLTKNGQARGLQCIQMKLGKPDESGRRRPMPITGSEFEMGVDNVIIAIGQAVDKSRLPAGLDYTTEGTVAADSATLETNIGGVFAGGDIVTGPATVTEAIGAGKRAAISIDRYLSNKPLRIKEKKRSVIGMEELNLKNTPLKHRAKVSILPVARRVQGFAEVEGGFTADVVADEAQRCLACASFKERCAALLHCPAIIRDIDGNTIIDSFLCNGCGVCADICPYGAIVKKEEI